MKPCVVAMGLALLAAACNGADGTTEEQSTRLEQRTSSSSFDYEALVSLIRDRRLSTIDELLPALPASFRSSYALMYESHSLQSADSIHPRVILFGADARLTCTFNGDASQVGFDSLECFQFRDAERAFDFRQIRFPTRSNGLTQVSFSERDRTTNGQTRCSSCHGADPRPSWDDYDQWPGAYGFDDDALGVDVPRYAEYVAQRATHPRYRHLIQDATPTAPFNPTYSATVARRPNLRFSDSIGRLNALRTTRLLEERVPKWQTLAFAVKALGCALTTDQHASLVAAGFDVDRELDLGRIFARVGISGRDWGTRVFDDTVLPKPWEHQAGYSYLSNSIAMAIAQDEARAGNQALATGLERIKAYLPTRYRGPDLIFHSTLAAIVPDPDIFGGQYEEHTSLVCPELARLFVDAALGL